MSLSDHFTNTLIALAVDQVREGNIQLLPGIKNPRPEFFLQARALAHGGKDNPIPVLFDFESIAWRDMQRFPQRLWQNQASSFIDSYLGRFRTHKWIIPW